MKYLGIEAIKKFNLIQNEIKQLYEQIKLYPHKYNVLRPRLTELLDLRDSYIV